MIRIMIQAMEEMIGDATGTFPDECCGFMFGTEEDGLRTVSAIQVVDNAKEGDKRRRFEISARDYMNAESLAEERGWQLLGIYHSHPNHPPVPSEHDRVAAQPFFSYLILSIHDRAFSGLRSWRLNDNFQFEEETIKDERFIHQNQ
ncbi:MAG TPA: M67 family metallopeptidase [Flavisolibacter sp.]|nr:M67 family metallopeptidase [Flavisolibacter sp.]